MSDAEGLGLPALAFARQDDGDDLQFYAPSRLVTHIDEGAVAGGDEDVRLLDAMFLHQALDRILLNLRGTYKRA